MPRDLSPLLPERIRLVFRGRRCSGQASDSVPAYYTSDVALTSLTLTDTNVVGGLEGNFGVTHTIRDTAVALFNVGNNTPTNKAALDALAQRVAQDYYDFRSQSYDDVFNGVINPAPSGLNDLIEWCYTADDGYTQVQSQPWDGEPEEMQHQDPAVANCTQAKNANNPVQVVPCLEYYGPPEKCVNGKIQRTRYRLCLEDGQLTSTFVSFDTIG